VAWQIGAKSVAKTIAAVFGGEQIIPGSFYIINTELLIGRQRKPVHQLQAEASLVNRRLLLRARVASGKLLSMGDGLCDFDP
jgi:hypothetical protein